MTWEIVEDEIKQPDQMASSQRGLPNTPTRYELVEDENKIVKPEFNWFQKHFTLEGQKAEAGKNRNFLKSILSGASAGHSEYFDILKPDYNQENSSAGYLTGAILPIGLTYKGLGLAFNGLTNLFKFGPKAQYGLELAHQFATGLTYGAEKQSANAIQGKEVDLVEPIAEGLEFAATGALLHAISATSKPVVKWLKSLNGKQGEDLVKGILPSDLTPNQYKFWEEKVAPEWLAKSQQEYEQATIKANEKSDLKFKQDMSIAKAQHEQELLETSQQNQISEETFQQAQEKYQNKIKQIAAEHEIQVAEIEASNEQMLQEFNEAQENFQQLQTRQAAVEQATILEPGQENLPYRLSPSNEINPSLENEVGNIVSKNEITNTTNAGRANVEAIRANDAIDYANVNAKYKVSDQLNEKVNTIHPNLVQELTSQRNELLSIPEPSPPQKQRLTAIEKILDKLRTVDSDGNITGFIEINNRVLQEQAKAFRYFMDFNFEHGNARGIFTPTVNSLENAVEFGARTTGNAEAAEASQEARASYRQWAQDYDNPYIRPYRDTRNMDFSKTFKGSLDVDEFKMVDNILSRSNAGQQLSATTKRALVEKTLGKFLENPHGANGKEFQLALRELSPVLTSEETNVIRQTFNEARNRPSLITRRPSPPNLKEIPNAKIPLFNKEKPAGKQVTSTKIPSKKFEETPAMKIASKEMNMTPEEIRKLANSPSGMTKLKEKVSPDVYKKIGHQRAQEIVYGGEVKPNLTGKKVFNRVNEGDNFSMLSKILGEEEAQAFLDAAEQIGEKSFTTENIKKHIKNYSIVKTLLLFGLL